VVFREEYERVFRPENRPMMLPEASKWRQAIDYEHVVAVRPQSEEGLIRQVPPFVRFLGVAGQLNGQVVNGHNIAREAAVPRTTVESYFSILTDTLVGHFLPAWRPGVKVREATHPKFHWFDPGVGECGRTITSHSA
jgi:hypothetical protein